MTYEPTIQQTGAVASLAEMQGRWLYSEFRSPRWREDRRAEFQGAEYEVLFEKARAAVRFEALLDSERGLIWGKTSREVSGLVAALQQFPAYRLVEWTKADVASSWVVPVLNPLRNGQVGRHADMMAAPEPTEASHPRVAAGLATSALKPQTFEPLIAVPWPTEIVTVPLLLDGTSRSIIFLKHGAETDVIPVWMGIRSSLAS